MARKYTVPFAGLSFTAQTEIMALTSASGKLAVVKKLKVQCDQVTLPAAQQFGVTGTVFTTAVNGTGGVATTPSKNELGDPAAVTTCLVQNTLANAGAVGTAPWNESAYLFLGIDGTTLPADGIYFQNGEIFVLKLTTTPLSGIAYTLRGWVEFWEIGL